MRRIHYLFLAMIAFAAAVASAPPPPRAPTLAEPPSWMMSDSARLALTGLDATGNPISP